MSSSYSRNRVAAGAAVAAAAKDDQATTADNNVGGEGSLSTTSKNDSRCLSLSERLVKGLEDDELADVELVGDDEGMPVPAFRVVLGCASPVLKSMLLGSFSEASNRVVRFPGYSSTTLSMVVNFCTTDKIITTQQQNNHHCQELMEVARFAHAFDVPDLMKYTRKTISTMMQETPSLACLVYKQADDATAPGLCGDAWKILLAQPRQALLTNQEGLAVLDAPEIQTIFQEKDQLQESDDLMLFEILTTWHAAKKQESTLDVCKELAKTIDLTAIEPMDLKEKVLSSEIVDKERVNEAFMEQAIKASRQGTVFSRKRGRGTDTSSSSSLEQEMMNRRMSFRRHLCFDDDARRAGREAEANVARRPRREAAVAGANIARRRDAVELLDLAGDDSDTDLFSRRQRNHHRVVRGGIFR